jgi:hypothetical protein
MQKKMCAPAAAALILGMTALAPEATRAQDIPGLDTAGIEQASGLKGQVIAEEKVFKIGSRVGPGNFTLSLSQIRT